jgi:hypothetical protein
MDFRSSPLAAIDLFTMPQERAPLDVSDRPPMRSFFVNTGCWQNKIWPAD